MNVLRSPYAAIAATTWLVIPATVLIAGGGTEPAGLLSGWVIAGVAGIVSFGLLARVDSGRDPGGTASFVQFMKALVWGFAARLVLVGAGFYLTLRNHQSPLWFSVGFFSFYFLSVVCEGLAYRDSLRHAPRAEALSWARRCWS
jgi:hypothetical protein